MVVDEMPAGRELDALVAEKVMGWREVQGKGYGAHSWWWDEKKPQHATYGAAWDGGWQPSANIWDAWEVVEKLRKHFPFVSVGIDYRGKWFARFGEDLHGNVDGYADGEETAPLALCRAALRAVWC